MDVTETTSPPPIPAADGPVADYEQCDRCGVPVDRAQRYCVACGARRRLAYDPAARYLADLTSRSRAGSRATRSPAKGNPRSPGLGIALLLAVIPLAVVLGVLVGRASSSGDDKLIAALRAQKPEVITTGATGAASAAAPASTANSVAALSSDFPLQKGYTVELQTLPAHGTDRAAVSRAEHAAESKGAKDVGLIVPSDFHLTPSPPARSDVIYAGAYKARVDAERALAKLKHSFNGAKVIAVQSAAALSSAAPTTKVLARSVYGTAHQVAGYKPSAAQLAAGGQVVSRIQQQQGKSYVNGQRGLPDAISVP